MLRLDKADRSRSRGNLVDKRPALKPEDPGPLDHISDDVDVICPECGHSQADMGRGVTCEQCGGAMGTAGVAKPKALEASDLAGKSKEHADNG